MSLRKITAAFTAALMMISVTSCSKADENKSNDSNDNSDTSIATSTSVGEEAALKNILPNEENVKLLGRAHFMDDKLYCAFSGTGAEFTFSGKECTVHITSDTTVDVNVNLARIGIYVDDERVIDDIIDEYEETYSVIRSDTDKTADIKIVKLSEAPMSTFAIDAIETDGEIKPAANREHLIEFIGDSITCGYGVDDEDSSHSFTTGTEDVTKAYAYKTAEKLNADYSIVAFSGHGIISGYSDGNRKVSEQCVPPYYTTLGYVYSTNGNFEPRSIEWDFSKRQPDLIVINLGTNDDSYCKGNKERREDFRDGYVKFLKKIRKNNPDAHILCTLGVMGNALYAKIEKAVADYTEETGDENVSSMMFEMQNPDVDGIAADFHPTERTHEKASDKLAAHIKEIMNW